MPIRNQRNLPLPKSGGAGANRFTYYRGFFIAHSLPRKAKSACWMNTTSENLFFLFFLLREFDYLVLKRSGYFLVMRKFHGKHAATLSHRTQIGRVLQNL
jgi:hypothetical protein